MFQFKLTTEPAVAITKKEAGADPEVRYIHYTEHYQDIGEIEGKAEMLTIVVLN